MDLGLGAGPNCESVRMVLGLYEKIWVRNQHRRKLLPVALFSGQLILPDLMGHSPAAGGLPPPLPVTPVRG